MDFRGVLVILLVCGSFRALGICAGPVSSLNGSLLRTAGMPEAQNIPIEANRETRNQQYEEKLAQLGAQIKRVPI